MAERQRGLGRGLSALMGEAVEAPTAAGATLPSGVQRVPIESLKPNPDQPRKIFTQEHLEELTASIRDKGVLQPILVRSQPGEDGVWQIIAGERRWRASQAARLTEVPIVVHEMDDVEVFEVAIIENVQRADLNPLEEADAYRVLMERFGRTQDQVAGIVGKSRSHIANTLRLLQLPEEVLWYVRNGKLTAGHARALIT
ncbi:MAG: ParB/RepB/Spo0J family partition protein, partial [Phenylobacterium sp.]|nr:ParB/RepB/Spo0J family partition protein [Phenylobacterium sp.]